MLVEGLRFIIPLMMILVVRHLRLKESAEIRRRFHSAENNNA